IPPLHPFPTRRSSDLADFYQAKLRAYFERPHYLWGHLLGYSKPLHQLLSELDALDRYLNAEERETMTQLAEFVRAKDNLDFQRRSEEHTSELQSRFEL